MSEITNTENSSIKFVTHCPEILRLPAKLIGLNE